MNLMAMKMSVKLFLHRGAVLIRRYAPQIMVGTGLAAGGATVALACKATLKTEEIMGEKDMLMNQLDEKKDSFGNDEQDSIAKDIRKDARWKLVKAWAPVATAGGASVALILGGHHMLGRRAAAALGAAYKAQQELFKRDEAIKEAFGEEVAEKIKNGLPLDKLEVGEKLKKLDEQEKANPRPVKAERYTVDWLFCEESCGARFRGCGPWSEDPLHNLEVVKMKEQQANDLLKSRGSLTVNDILIQLFDADPIDAGMGIGWVWDTEFGTDVISFGIEDLKTWEGARSFQAKGEPNIWLRFNVRQRPDKISLDAIKERRRHKQFPKYH